MDDQPGTGYIRIVGAAEHNLRTVDVDIPRNSLIMFTGVSGSGKSSLAFSTIYAESQRRFFESVAPYARRLLQQVGVPKVGAITGLPPAVALGQRHGGGSSRSTVGTLTTLSNSLRMLLSRAGTYPDGATEVLDSDAFSANTVAGACPRCHGLGTTYSVTESTLVPDPTLSIRQGAIAAWPGAWLGKNLRDILATLGYDVDLPWRELPEADREWILFTQEQPVVTVHPIREAGRIQRPYQGKYSGTQRYVLHTLSETKSPTIRTRMLQFVNTDVCSLCAGFRLATESLAVTFAGYNVSELAAKQLSELADILLPTAEMTSPTAAWLSPRSGETSEVARSIARDLRQRIGVLADLGLGYLTMDRITPTLSPGELTRVRLASATRSGLFGVLYVLDEPSAGLHPVDVIPLLNTLRRLRDAGNTVLVVEHEMALVAAADWVVDVGPGAGAGGGNILYSGPTAGLTAVDGSVTSRYLHPTDRPAAHEPRKTQDWLQLDNIHRNNLHGTAARIPLGVLTSICGVSGSGKSTLVDALAESLLNTLEDNASHDNATCSELKLAGAERISRLIQVNQAPIGRTPRSNLATYTGLFDAVRKVFAATEMSRLRGYTASRFSFNISGGRCPTCEGEGYVAVELLFLPGTYSPCPTCHGTRYNEETLAVTYRDLTIAQVLDLTVVQAQDFFADNSVVATSLDTLVAVGLGYLTLGQPATELSGGEAQRIKLAAELQRGGRGSRFYLLDEPTTGLHPADTAILMDQLQALVGAGHTVLVVEHDLSVIGQSDWVIEMGPGAGAAGGTILSAGTPEHLSSAPHSPTAPYLYRFLHGEQ